MREQREVKTRNVPTTVGPTPFTGMSNAAAIAMATSLTRAQAPTAVPTAGEMRYSACNDNRNISLKMHGS